MFHSLYSSLTLSRISVLSRSLSAFLSLLLPIYLVTKSIYQYICIAMCLSAYLPHYLFIHLSFCLNPSICPLVYVATRPYVCLNIFYSIYLSAFPFPTSRFLKLTLLFFTAWENKRCFVDIVFLVTLASYFSFG